MSTLQVLALIGMAVALALLLRAFVLVRGIGGAEAERAKQRYAGVSLLVAAALVGRALPGVVDDSLVTVAMLALGIPGVVLVLLAIRRHSA